MRGDIDRINEQHRKQIEEGSNPLFEEAIQAIPQRGRTEEATTYRYEINCVDGNSYKIRIGAKINNVIDQGNTWLYDLDGDKIQIKHITRIRPLR